MIKLIDFSNPNADITNNDGVVIYVNKDIIKRIEQGNIRVIGKEESYPVSFLYDINGNRICYVKETPEEILAMPDIETTEKVIDWEQRRYEIVKSILGIIFKVSNETDDFTERECIAETAIRYADALINELKKGQGNEN